MSTLDKIIELLDNGNLTQKDLTDFLGLGKGAFSGWKSGKTNSYLKYISQIAEFLNVSADYLLNKTDDPHISIKTKSPTMQMIRDIVDGRIKIEENPTTTNDSEGKVSDDDIKFALFNSSEDITDEMFDEVKRFAQHIANEKKRKANEKV